MLKILDYVRFFPYICYVLTQAKNEKAIKTQAKRLRAY
jgi:hypothetical protein